MKKFTLAVTLALSLLALPAAMTHAGTVKIPKEKSAASVTVPDAWAPEETDDGIQAESPDKVVTILIEVTSGKGVDALIDANVDWLVKDNNVKIDPASKKEQDVKLGGRDWSRISWDGETKEDGPAVVGFLFTQLANGKILTVTYWITKKDADKQFDALEKIFASVKEVQ